MKEEVIELDTVDKYNKFFKVETYHPMVTVVDLSKITQPAQPFTINYGIYALFLKDTLCGDITYGRQPYDYQEGTIVCFAPGQVASIHAQEGTRPTGYGLLFHPDLFAVPNWDTTSGIILSSLTKPAKPCTSRKKNGTR